MPAQKVLSNVQVVMARPQQREERVAGGKRRIIPQAVGNTAAMQPMESSVPFGDIMPANQTEAQPIVIGSPSSMAGDGSAKKRRIDPSSTSIVPKAVVGGNGLSIPKRNLLPGASMKSTICLSERGVTPATLLEAVKVPHESGVQIVCSRGGKRVWTDFLGASFDGFTGVAGKYVVVATSDSVFFLYSADSGKRLLPPVSIDAPPYLMDVAQPFNSEKESPYFLTLVTRLGTCTVYNLEDRRLVCSRSVAGLLCSSVEKPTAENMRNISVRP